MIGSVWNGSMDSVQERAQASQVRAVRILWGGNWDGGEPTISVPRPPPARTGVAGAGVWTTMAYVGTLAMFERAGFTKTADAVSGGIPRVLTRLDLE